MALLQEEENPKIRVGYLLHGERNIGGGEKGILLLILNLDRRRFEPIVFYSKENSIIQTLKSSGVLTVQISMSKKITTVYRSSISYCPISLLSYGYHLIKTVFVVAKTIKNYRISILHPHDNLSKIIGGIAAKVKGIKVIAHCRDQLNKSVIERGLGLFQRIMMDHVISNSECVKSLIPFGEGCEKITTIYNGIDLKEFDPKVVQVAPLENWVSDRARYVIFGIIAVFDALKGHKLLFEAIRKMKKSSEIRFMCLVVGNGREEQGLRRFVNEHALENEIKFLGYRSDIPQILKALDFIVIPSQREALPRIALEAMAMSVPVIATNVGGTSEAVVHNETGLLIPYGDVNVLFDAMKKLIENPTLRKDLGHSGRTRVESFFNLQDNIIRIENIYYHLCVE